LMGKILTKDVAMHYLLPNHQILTFVKITCLNRTIFKFNLYIQNSFLFRKKKAGPKEVLFRQVSLYYFSVLFVSRVIPLIKYSKWKSV
jgi:hypothetical protein